MANLASTISKSPWEHSIVFRLRGGSRVEVFISEPVAERLRHTLDEGGEGFVVFDSEDARIAVNCNHLFLHHIRRYPGRRVKRDSTADLSLKILFSESMQMEKFAVNSDIEDAEEENDPRASILQLLMQNVEIGDPRAYFVDDGGDEVNFDLKEVALISVPLLHVVPSMKSADD